MRSMVEGRPLPIDDTLAVSGGPSTIRFANGPPPPLGRMKNDPLR